MLTTLLILTVALFLGACGKQEAGPSAPPDIREAGVRIRDLTQCITPAKEPLALEPFARLDKRFIPECSGFAASHRHAGVIWTHSDSDNPNTLVAVRADGSVIKPPGAPDSYRGIVVKGVKNIDWEAVAVTADGELILGDIGNNNDRRRNLRLLAFPEPDPFRDTAVTPRIFPVRHRDQRNFNPKNNKHYDCEAMFIWGGSLYFFTKRWSDTWTVLCRLEPEFEQTLPPTTPLPPTPVTSILPPNARSGMLVPVGAFDARGLVTDAAISPSGARLAVLTYHNVWLFELPPAPLPDVKDAPISGKATCLPLRFPLPLWQAEALAFDSENSLLIGTEQGALFRIPIPQ